MVPSGHPVCVTCGMPHLRELPHHRPGAVLLYRVLANYPPTPAPSLSPLRSAVCLPSGHGLYTEPSLPTVSGTATGIPTSLDPLPLSPASEGSNLLIQVSNQTHPGAAARTPDDQCLAESD